MSVIFQILSMRSLLFVSLVICCQFLTSSSWDHASIETILVPIKIQAKISKNDIISFAVNSVSKTEKGLRLEHPNYVWDFSSHYLKMKPLSLAPTWSWNMHGVTPTLPRFSDNKIIYQRGNVSEEYVIKSNLVEQQFIFLQPSENSNKGITIRAAITSSGVLNKNEGGWSWSNEFGEVTMTNAIAFDAKKRAIPVCMEVINDQIIIEIDGIDIKNAEYPITIDPEIATNDFRISTIGTDGDASIRALDPAVSYNKLADRYLVVWVGGNILGDLEIYGQLINGSTGAKFGGEIQVSNMGPISNVNFNANSPEVASSGNEFLVVWNGDNIVDEAVEIYGQRIDVSGNELGTNDFRISDMGTNDSDGNYAAFSSSVVYNNTQKQYMVVWTGDDDTSPLVNDEFEIYAQRLDSLGDEVGADTKISDMGGPDGNVNYGAFTPDVIWNKTNNEYIVVWRGDDSAVPLVDNEFEIFLQRLSGTTGGQLGSNDVRISDMGTDGLTAYGAFAPSISYNKTNNNFLVVWHGDDDTGGVIDNENEIYGQMITNLGAESGSDFRISDMGPVGDGNYDAQNPSASFDPFLNYYLVSWQGDDNLPSLIDNEIEIFGQLLTGTGSETGTNDFRLSDVGGTGNSTYNAADPSLVFNDTQREFLLVWEADDNDVGTIDGEFEIFGQRFAELSTEPTTNPTSPLFSSITSASYTVGFSAAAGPPNGYLVLRKSGSSPTDVPTDQQVYAVNDIIGTSTVAFVGSTLTFNQSGLNEGTTYHYDFFSYNGVNSSTNYRTTSPLEGNVTTLATEPSAHAASFTATQAGTNQINLAFSAASTISNADGYIILRRQDGTNPTASGIIDGAVAPSIPAAGTTLVTTIASTATIAFNDTGATLFCHNLFFL